MPVHSLSNISAAPSGSAESPFQGSRPGLASGVTHKPCKYVKESRKTNPHPPGQSTIAPGTAARQPLRNSVRPNDYTTFHPTHLASFMHQMLSFSSSSVISWILALDCRIDVNFQAFMHKIIQSFQITARNTPQTEVTSYSCCPNRNASTVAAPRRGGGLPAKTFSQAACAQRAQA